MKIDVKKKVELIKNLLKTMLPASTDDLILFLGTLLGEEPELSEEKLIPQVWIVVYDDYKGNITPDVWEREYDETIVGIYSNKGDAEKNVREQNAFVDAMHEGHGENEPGTTASL